MIDNIKILFDHQIFDSQKVGGISRYHFEIISRLKKNSILPIKVSQNEYLKNAGFITLENDKYSFENFLPNLSFKGKVRLFNIRNKVFRKKPISNKDEVIRILKEQNFDIFHPTYYDTYFLEYLGKKPFIITIHDMIYEKYPELFFNFQKTIENKKELIKKASHIIAISQNTKSDIMQLYNIEESKISVIYHGSSLKEKSDSLKNFKEIFGTYILYTGSRTIYKNFYFMINAISDYIRINNINMVCTGGAFSKEETEIFSELGIQGQIFHFFATENELYNLYHDAAAFIFPSYYEGFGIPILESFEAGCPLVCSNTSCFPEIAQDAAYYFNPKSKQEILQAIDKALTSTSTCKISKGFQILNQFTWEESAKKHFEVYTKISI